MKAIYLCTRRIAVHKGYVVVSSILGQQRVKCIVFATKYFFTIQNKKVEYYGRRKEANVSNVVSHLYSSLTREGRKKVICYVFCGFLQMEYIHLITGYTWVLCGMGLKSRAAIFFGSKAAVVEQLSLVGLVVYVERDLVKGRDQVWNVFCHSKK